MKYDFIAGGFVVNNNDQLLLVDHKKLGLWLPFGGHVELGEQPHEALIRECREELPGLELKFLQISNLLEDSKRIPMHMNTHIYEMVSDNTTSYPHKHYCINYLCSTDSTNFDYNREELNGFNWFNRKELISLERTPENIREFSLYALKTGREIL